MISRKFSNGEAIYRRGEAAASAFELRVGHVRLSWPDEGGGELSTVLGVGQVFGAAELISGEARPATAEALGVTVLSELERDELARLFASDTELVGTMLRPVFQRLRLDEDAVRVPPEIPAPQQAELFPVSELLLKPAAREVSQQMEAGGIRVASLPFHVGRRSSRPLPAGGGGGLIDLALRDIRPYTLSRRHFAIEADQAGYVVRDCGSRHGTIVNGASIGAGTVVATAPLVRGENRIVAGRSMSPFRFTLTVAA